MFIVLMHCLRLVQKLGKALSIASCGKVAHVHKCALQHDNTVMTVTTAVNKLRYF